MCDRYKSLDKVVNSDMKKKKPKIRGYAAREKGQKRSCAFQESERCSKRKQAPHTSLLWFPSQFHRCCQRLAQLMPMKSRLGDPNLYRNKHKNNRTSCAIATHHIQICVGVCRKRMAHGPEIPM